VRGSAAFPLAGDLVETALSDDVGGRCFDPGAGRVLA
jgi:hypothetical protein